MELLDLYNNKKEKIGKVYDRDSGEPGRGEYKLSVHVWIVNSKDQFLIQKRSENVKNPGKWAFTGGAVDAGESSVDGALREVREELGINVSKDEIEYFISFKREKGFVDVWLIQKDIDISDIIIQEEEVADVKWASLKEIKQLIDDDLFVHSVNLYFKMFVKLLKKCHNITMEK